MNRQYQFICNYLGYVSKRYFYEAIIIVSYFDDPQEYNKKILNNESESLRGPFWEIYGCENFFPTNSSLINGFSLANERLF